MLAPKTTTMTGTEAVIAAVTEVPSDVARAAKSIFKAPLEKYKSQLLIGTVAGYLSPKSGHPLDVKLEDDTEKQAENKTD